MNQTSKLLDLLMSVRPTELRNLITKFLNIGYREVDTVEGKFWLDPTSNFGYRVLKYGRYETETTEAIKKFLCEGDTFIDIGANEGWYSVIAGKKVGKTGHVFMVEPQRRVWPIIENNLKLNSLSNCTLVPYAIGEHCEARKIILTPSHDTGISTLVDLPRFFLCKRESIELRTLDWLLDNYKLDVVKLIKIDIEGYELFAIRSGSNVLSSKRIKNFYIEIHNTHLKRLNLDPKELFHIMEQYEYTVKSIKGGIFFSVESFLLNILDFDLYCQKMKESTG